MCIPVFLVLLLGTSKLNNDLNSSSLSLVNFNLLAQNYIQNANCPVEKDLTEHINDEIFDRTSSAIPESSPTDLFISRGNSASWNEEIGGVWERNPNVLKSNNKLLDFSGVSPWNSGTGYNRAGTLITPRHIIYANHYNPSKGEHPIEIGTKINFVDMNNSIVERTLVDSRKVYGTDIQVGLLNEDVPENIPFYPILDSGNLEKYLGNKSKDLFLIALNQDHDVIVREILQPINSVRISHKIPVSDQLNLFSKNLRVGDSGNPMFFSINGDLVLIAGHASKVAGPSYSFYKKEIQDTINQMSSGYTLKNFDLSCFRPHIVLSDEAPLVVPEKFDVGDNVGSIKIKSGLQSGGYVFSISKGNEDGLLSINSSTGKIVVASKISNQLKSSSREIEISVKSDVFPDTAVYQSYKIYFEDYLPKFSALIEDKKDDSINFAWRTTSAKPRTVSIPVETRYKHHIFKNSVFLGTVEKNTFTDLDFKTEEPSRYLIYVESDNDLIGFSEIIINPSEINTPNNAPILSSIGDQDVVEESTLSLEIEATDADRDTLSYSVDSLPENASFNPNSRKFIFEPDQTQEGQYDITFIVSDGELKDEEAIVITVTNLGDSKSIDDSDNDGILDTQDKCPNTPANIKTHVNKFGCPKPVHTNFDTGTDLDDVDPTASITGLELGVSNKGKIKFLEDVTLNTSSYITKRVNLDNLIKIEKNKVTIDSDSAPQLNRRATIELEGVEFDTPVIKKDGNVILCPFRVDASGDEDCIIESYDKSTGLLVFTVSGFSTYEIQEGSGENETTVSEVKPTSSVNTDKRTSSGGRGGSSSKDSGEKEVTLINFLKILLFFGLISQDQVNFITSLFI